MTSAFAPAFAFAPWGGTALVGLPNTAGRGGISAGTLETSNVDLSEEFTRLIIAQRGFQANSRIITVSDEMIHKMVNLKRQWSDASPIETWGSVVGRVPTLRGSLAAWPFLQSS
jgi:hypothetical protein